MRLVANTHVQHVVNTVEAEVPLSHFIDKAVEILVVAQRQISMVQTLQTSIEIPQSQITDKVIDVPVVQAEHVPQVAQSEVVEAIEIEMKNHRSRVGPGASRRLGEARRPRCPNQVPRGRSAFTE